MIDEVAQRIVLAVGKTFTLQGVEQKIGASLGIAFYREDGETLDILIKHADTAMYEVKKMGRNNYLYYQSSVHSNSFNDIV